VNDCKEIGQYRNAQLIFNPTVSGVHVFQRFEQLVDNVLLVNVFQDVRSYNSMKIGFCNKA